MYKMQEATGSEWSSLCQLKREREGETDVDVRVKQEGVGETTDVTARRSWRRGDRVTGSRWMQSGDMFVAVDMLKGTEQPCLHHYRKGTRQKAMAVAHTSIRGGKDKESGSETKSQRDSKASQKEKKREVAGRVSGTRARIRLKRTQTSLKDISNKRSTAL